MVATTTLPIPVETIPTDLRKLFVICTDLFGNKEWKYVPLQSVREALSRNEDVLLVDTIGKRCSVYPKPVLEEILGDSDDESYKHVSLSYHDEFDKWIVDDLMYKFLKTFHWTWYNELKEFLYTDEFISVLRVVQADRIKQPVFPEKEVMFRVFLTDLRRIRGIWLGLSPYTGNNIANGYAFSTDRPVKTPSLMVLEEGIRQSCGYGFIWSGLRNDLLELRKNGILLLNIALTTNGNDSCSHVEIWKPFTEKVVSVLNKIPDLSWMVFGKEAQKYSPLITNETHTVYECYHPSHYARAERPMLTDAFCNFFNKLNIKLDVEH